jgi:hypothetical protein
VRKRDVREGEKWKRTWKKYGKNKEYCISPNFRETVFGW